jgi:hypothetical protein
MNTRTIGERKLQYNSIREAIMAGESTIYISDSKEKVKAFYKNSKFDYSKAYKKGKSNAVNFKYFLKELKRRKKVKSVSKSLPEKNNFGIMVQESIKLVL